MIKKTIVSQSGDDGGCRVPVGVIDPDTIECRADLDAAITAYDADALEYPDRVHVAEWEECEW